MDNEPGRFVRVYQENHLSDSDDGNDAEEQRERDEWVEEHGYQHFGSPLRSSSPSERNNGLEMERDELVQDLRRLFTELLDDEVAQTFSAAELSIRQARIERYFSEFESVHRNYRRMFPQSSHNIFIEMETECMNVMAKIMTLLKGMEQRENVVSSTQLERTDGGLTTFRVELPVAPRVGIFTGAQAEWPEFRDKFLAQVHEKDHISPVDKMTYLQEACQGEAKITLGPWPSTSEGYAGAWNQLMRAYNDNYHNVHGIISRILSTPKQNQESHEALRTVVSTVSGGIRQLRTMIDSAVERDQLWIHLAKQRLPPSTVDAWEQYRNRGDAPGMPTFEYFQGFLEVRAKGRRELEYGSTRNTNSETEKIVSHSKNHHNSERRHQSYSGDKNQSHNRSDRSNRYKPYDKRDRSDSTTGHNNQTYTVRNETQYQSRVSYVCPLCSDSKPLYFCEKFKGMDITQRRSFVMRNGQYCLCCLSVGHRVVDCKYPTCNRCPEDSRKHHKFICLKEGASTSKRGEVVTTTGGKNHGGHKSQKE